MMSVLCVLWMAIPRIVTCFKNIHVCKCFVCSPMAKTYNREQTTLSVRGSTLDVRFIERVKYL